MKRLVVTAEGAEGFLFGLCVGCCVVHRLDGAGGDLIAGWDGRWVNVTDWSGGSCWRLGERQVGELFTKRAWILGNW